MPSLRCLVSALTQAGGGDLLFKSTSSVQSCCGEGGALQADVAVCGEHSPSSGHTWFAPYRGVLLSPSALLRLPAALHGAGPALSAVLVFRYSTKARIRLRLRFVFPGLSGLGSQGLGLPLPGAARLFPPRPQRALQVGCLRLVFVLRRWPLAATLPAADVDHPESQEVFR